MVPGGGGSKKGSVNLDLKRFFFFYNFSHPMCFGRRGGGGGWGLLPWGLRGSRGESTL